MEAGSLVLPSFCGMLVGRQAAQRHQSNSKGIWIYLNLFHTAIVAFPVVGSGIGTPTRYRKLASRVRLCAFPKAAFIVESTLLITTEASSC